MSIRSLAFGVEFDTWEREFQLSGSATTVPRESLSRNFHEVQPWFHWLAGILNSKHSTLFRRSMLSTSRLGALHAWHSHLLISESHTVAIVDECVAFDQSFSEAKTEITCLYKMEMPNVTSHSAWRKSVGCSNKRMISYTPGEHQPRHRPVHRTRSARTQRLVQLSEVRSLEYTLKLYDRASALIKLKPGC